MVLGLELFINPKLFNINMVIINNSGDFLESLIKNKEGKDLETRLFSALKDLKILKDQEELAEYDELHGWKRGGGETYVASAKLKIEKDGKRYERTFVSKAIVTLSIDITIKNMIKRKKLLEDEGVKTPEIYSISDGCINQQYILYSIKEAIKLGKFNNKLLDEIIFIASQIDKMGFYSLNYIADLRTDLKHIYYADFGFDLGEPNENVVSDTAYNRLISFVNENIGLKIKEKNVKEKYKKFMKLKP